ncbi:DNA-directed RNA polymerase subunit beta' [Striga asiatica]|uniref:DNA-directed RNA polymerase subunit beta n=1 Tax=Striga asiatica TaxID=4170 RepID=A0A5A7REA8_STRAF|nr:DNA-directed RNA polymerase subunit beta' [Striga asiatica]
MLSPSTTEKLVEPRIEPSNPFPELNRANQASRLLKKRHSTAEDLPDPKAAGGTGKEGEQQFGPWMRANTGGWLQSRNKRAAGTNPLKQRETVQGNGSRFAVLSENSRDDYGNVFNESDKGKSVFNAPETSFQTRKKERRDLTKRMDSMKDNKKENSEWHVVGSRKGNVRGGNGKSKDNVNVVLHLDHPKVLQGFKT